MNLNCDEKVESVSYNITTDEVKTALRDYGLEVCFNIFFSDNNGNLLSVDDISMIRLTFMNNYCEYPFHALYGIEESEEHIELFPYESEDSEDMRMLAPDSEAGINGGMLYHYTDNAKKYTIEVPEGSDNIAVDANSFGKIDALEELEFTTAENGFTLYVEGADEDSPVFIYRNNSQSVGGFWMCLKPEYIDKMSAGPLYASAVIGLKNGKIFTTGSIKLADVK